MAGLVLNAEEWRAFLLVAEKAEGPLPHVGVGRLMMRGLVDVDGEGKAVVTGKGSAALEERADSLVGCLEGSAEEAELARLSDVLDRQAVVRF